MSHRPSITAPCSAETPCEPRSHQRLSDEQIQEQHFNKKKKQEGCVLLCSLCNHSPTLQCVWLDGCNTLKPMNIIINITITAARSHAAHRRLRLITLTRMNEMRKHSHCCVKMRGVAVDCCPCVAWLRVFFSLTSCPDSRSTPPTETSWETSAQRPSSPAVCVCVGGRCDATGGGSPVVGGGR